MDKSGRLSPLEARARGRAARRAISPEARSAASATIGRQVGRLRVMHGALTVAGYWPTTEEVDLIGLWRQIHSSGVSVCMPRLGEGGSTSMEFVHWDPMVPMVDNRFAIPEPSGTASPIDALDVVVMPCTAVDDAGTRVGMGAGFYDRALASFTGRTRSAGANSAAARDRPEATRDPKTLVPADRPRPTLVCVAFESQLVLRPDSIERQSWDVPADIVVTESRVLGT